MKSPESLQPVGPAGGQVMSKSGGCAKVNNVFFIKLFPFRLAMAQL
jgi:hypothetical protein